MKRTPLQRRTPMRRTQQRAPRQRTKYRSRPRETDYMLGVKRLPCAALLVPGHRCTGPIEADHAGPRGIGRKAHDSTVIPLCQQAHRERTDFSGPFRGWDQAQMREFLAGRIIQTQRFMRARGWTIPTTERDIGEVVTPHVTRFVDPVVVISCHLDEERLSDLMAAHRHAHEDLREDGDIDVRNPEAALAASLVEGDR